MSDDTKATPKTARERLQSDLETWGLNKTVPVRSDDLRDLLADSSDAYVRGWNACCDTFNVGAHIAAVKPKPDVN